MRAHCDTLVHCETRPGDCLVCSLRIARHVLSHLLFTISVIRRSSIAPLYGEIRQAGARSPRAVREHGMPLANLSAASMLRNHELGKNGRHHACACR